jgi:hypothetical protein
MTDDQPNYFCNDDDLNSLTHYFNAALTGEESKSRLQQMWEQEIGVIKATRTAAKRYELPACGPDKPYGMPSHPAAKICTECHASTCCVLWDCPLRNEIWRDAQEKAFNISRAIAHEYELFALLKLREFRGNAKAILRSAFIDKTRQGYPTMIYRCDAVSDLEEAIDKLIESLHSTTTIQKPEKRDE